MNKISIPVITDQLPPRLTIVVLKLNPSERMTSRSVGKQLRNLLTTYWCSEITGITLTCYNGTHLPDMSASEYATQHGTIRARGFLQKLQQEVTDLHADAVKLSEDLAFCRRKLIDIQRGRTQQQEDERVYRKALRREIVLRARDLLSHEGGQVAGSDFSKFTTQLSAAFLEERDLTESAIIHIAVKSFFARGAAVGHYSSPEELRHGLDGSTGAKLQRLTLIYNYVVRRQR